MSFSEARFLRFWRASALDCDWNSPLSADKSFCLRELSFDSLFFLQISNNTSSYSSEGNTFCARFCSSESAGEHLVFAQAQCHFLVYSSPPIRPDMLYVRAQEPSLCLHFRVQHVYIRKYCIVHVGVFSHLGVLREIA